jgi:hypothetical protein
MDMGIFDAGEVAKISVQLGVAAVATSCIATLFSTFPMG